MKSILSALLLIFAAITSSAQDLHFTGHVDGVSDTDMLTSINGHDTDTIRIDKNGNFEYIANVPTPQFTYFSIKEKKSSFMLFVENGMKCHADITLEPADYEGEKYNKAILKLTGDNASANDLNRDFNEWNDSGWSDERVNATSFADYKKECEETLQGFMKRLDTIESEAFKERMKEAFSNADHILMRFAWKHKAYDEDFTNWMNSFNRNNPKNFEFARMYFRWYTTHHPKQEQQKQHEWYFGLAKEVFTNQMILDGICFDFMSSSIKNSDKNLPEIWDAFCEICSDTAIIANMKPKYDSAMKVMPGKVCEDFAMLDAAGKVWHLSDLKGRAIFIDVWATWCGPCCFEIPFVEKLVEHYKNDSRIEFVSISFDSKRDAWLKKIEADKPAWKQFICDDEQKEALKNMFGISGIPRFLFIDKDGKIISGNAPRPSSKNVIEYIDGKVRF